MDLFKDNDSDIQGADVKNACFGIFYITISTNFVFGFKAVLRPSFTLLIGLMRTGNTRVSFHRGLQLTKKLVS